MLLHPYIMMGQKIERDAAISTTFEEFWSKQQIFAGINECRHPCKSHWESYNIFNYFARIQEPLNDNEEALRVSARGSLKSAASRANREEETLPWASRKRRCDFCIKWIEKKIKLLRLFKIANRSEPAANQPIVILKRDSRLSNGWQQEYTTLIPQLGSAQCQDWKIREKNSHL